MDRVLEESEFDDEDDEDYDDDFLDADDDEFATIQDHVSPSLLTKSLILQVTETQPTGFKDPEDDEPDESTKNLTGYGMAAATVAVNFSGDGGGGQDSVRSVKQKKRVTGAAIAATGLLSVPGL